MIFLALLALALLLFVITCVLGVALNISRALLGKDRPMPNRAYWDPRHPRYREAHTVYLSVEPPTRG